MTVNPRESFKLKLCLSILGVSLLVFLLIFSATVYFTRKEIMSNVSTIVTSKLAMADKALDDMLSEVEMTSENLIGLVNSPYLKFDRKSANQIGESFLDANKHVQGVCIGYEDGSMFGHPGPWCPYVMRQNGTYVERDLSETKDFRSSEWYKTPHDTRSKCWSQPFRESNGTVIVSYNTPIINEETDEVVCVMAVDQSLTDLSDSLQRLSPYEGSALYLVDKEGRYIAHPDHDAVLERTASADVIQFIRSGEEYYVDKTEGHEVFIFPSKVERTGWTVLLSIPRAAILERTNKMLNTMLIDMLLGIILLLAVSLFVIDRLTKPLDKFADAARHISHGDFSVELPVIKDHNELYDLRSALASMKVSLDRYIEDLEETSMSKASMEKELDIARKIQMAMIPKIFPPYPERDSLDIFASLDPAQAVGGDLYDFVLQGDKFFFCIGDVSGKGVPASLLMAITRTLFRNTASADKTPGQIARILNDAICDGNEMGMFVTMMICSYDLVTGELKICNCGHNLPATNGLISDPQSMTVTPGSAYHFINGIPTNIAVGVLPGFEYSDITMQITPGCMLMLYTDGITEAENEKGELYEEERMLSFLRSMPDDSCSSEIVNGLVSDVRKFVGKAQPADDITVLCIRSKHLD